MQLILPAQQTPIDYNIRVADNYMSHDWCEQLYNQFTHTPGKVATFPWYCSQILYDDTPQSSLNCSHLQNVHFSHNFYSDGNSCSDHGHLIQPLIDNINPDILYRAKANLTTYNELIIKHGYHTDEAFPGFTSILFLNTCDGSTSFKFNDSIQEVDAIQGRLVTFDNRILHSGSTTTNTNTRAVIVINYYKHEYALQLGPEPIRITVPNDQPT
ncbi:DNA endonuclease V [Synechococcus phage ACG-2014b]|uniref:DNA endonuclease V n=2 Tax=Synechococcus phage ACG-2014b TaxID=1493508 RepID=A0A0E3FT69_9CAUD|nr:DNA endonuclease V [Synechococcus phage ACG-2014b]YP_009779704.1 DNA endonuclease V [Synechococcus phage ACG-2014b]AIX17298.1 DNA endonuclease V [Synechococcus phage ACG-2014b]AIX17510.1 DNA endonuclease V [Synechococcus phage ACG-2014b]AIX17725.1 DNA endonuclease V [Synechococcus phage ACG-2014b]AIX17943.1 DNA endonuclease V [Synechococcus phage ACG-2014b]AIX18158.1 DNA endonuclease V [Synechococcus phage ACG-2014b]